jgi:lipopolysaccharide/colanic/teichoic acid biosynthesis glycosyltransferase
MLKFRTTIHNPKHATAAWARQITQMGHVLRYTRIEDLPQLVNVLRGEMNMIDRHTDPPSFLD